MANADEPFGGVVVKGRQHRPRAQWRRSRWQADAERIVRLNAQGRHELKATIGAVIFTTARPCVAGEDGLAVGNVERMRFGADGSRGRKAAAVSIGV